MPCPPTGWMGVGPRLLFGERPGPSPLSREHLWKPVRSGACQDVWRAISRRHVGCVANIPRRIVRVTADARAVGAIPAAHAQRVAFYEFVTPSLKAAETLSSACPAEAALTPTGRMETMRKRLAAVRVATAAIRPALAHFYEALDQKQKVRFSGMS